MGGEWGQLLLLFRAPLLILITVGPKGCNGTAGIDGAKGARGMQGDPGLLREQGDKGVQGRALYVAPLRTELVEQERISKATTNG